VTDFPPLLVFPGQGAEIPGDNVTLGGLGRVNLDFKPYDVSGE
jgi:hypothetical protein